MGFLAPLAVPIFIGATVVSTYLQYKSAKDQARDEKAIRDYNASLLDQQAAQERRASMEEQRVKREEANRRIEAMRAGYAKGGVLPNTAVLMEAATTMAEDIAVLAHEREMKALESQRKAAVERFYGESALKAGKMRAYSSLIGGIGQMASFGANYSLLKGAGTASSRSSGPSMLSATGPHTV